MRTTFIIFFALACFSSGAQNLVANPDFEIYSTDSFSYSWGFNRYNYNFSKGYIVKDWKSISMTNKEDTRTSTNHHIAPSFANSGIAYAEVCMGYPENWSRFPTPILQGKLVKKLEKGKSYKIEFYIRFMSDDNACTNRIDVFFGGKNYEIDTLKKLKPYYTYSGDFLKDRFRWVKIEGIITAAGNEEYIYFGVIENHPENCMVFNKRNYMNRFADYYIDNISLTDLTEDK